MIYEIASCMSVVKKNMCCYIVYMDYQNKQCALGHVSAYYNRSYTAEI